MTFCQKVYDIEGFCYDSGQTASRRIPFPIRKTGTLMFQGGMASCFCSYMAGSVIAGWLEYHSLDRYGFSPCVNQAFFIKKDTLSLSVNREVLGVLFCFVGQILNGFFSLLLIQCRSDSYDEGDKGD